MTSTDKPSAQTLLQRYQSILAELVGHQRPNGNDPIDLLAVSKYAPDEAVQVLIDAGHIRFGESRPQNLRDRATRWPDCEWHMIGPVQKNKAKYIGRHAAMWHSCANLDTARAVARHVQGRVLPVLIQINMANVEGQSGISPDTLTDFAQFIADIDGLQLSGLMCMGPKDGDARQAFQALRALRDKLFAPGSALADGILCMGMSGDYPIAVEEGASMVRLGSTLFGNWDVRRSST